MQSLRYEQNRRVVLVFDGTILMGKKYMVVIFPRNTSRFHQIMASISAVASLSNIFPAKQPPVSVLPPASNARFVCRSFTDSSSSSSNTEDASESLEQKPLISRRKIVLSASIGLLAVAIPNSQRSDAAVASEYADMPALRGKDYGKSKMRYPDYTETTSGLQYKDLRLGSGPTPKTGEIVVVDWDGYTIGYYGRIFEARNRSKGGSFEGDDKDFYKFRVGSQEVIPAFEEAITGMALGGIRRIIVPPELGYPDNDYNKKGPQPTTFSGQRALDFVLRNQGLIDKTLLFDIELMKIVPNGRG